MGEPAQAPNNGVCESPRPFPRNAATGGRVQNSREGNWDTAGKAVPAAAEVAPISDFIVC